ncbi:TetR/AcrR family transcriptional regulator [Oceaniserpentilla sp. 4NH20-0058]|uniref:TetR/AcrR family transcriptional regulator n=1 Tax=Oceaniserpentilla sp. 4NH20-0058 TaxID=3127660 RepID=UPI00310B6A3E
MSQTPPIDSLETSANQPYHHGNLRLALINASVDIIRAQGVAGLSLRKLADAVGVSRTAPYHHFKDKDALLAAVASEGFSVLHKLLDQVSIEPNDPLNKILERSVMDYLNFAIKHPTEYELMFGAALWQDKQQAEFQRTAKDCFRQYVILFEKLQSSSKINTQESPLRLAQITWATLHGLARLASDGVFAQKEDIHSIAQTAISQLVITLRV